MNRTNNSLIVTIIDDDIHFANQLASDIDTILTKKSIFYKIIINPNEINNNDRNCHYCYFLDIEMPDIDGFTLAKRIHKSNRNSQIVFISNFDSYVFDSYDYYAVNYFLKAKYKNKLDYFFERLITQDLMFYSFVYNDIPLSISLHNILYINKHKHLVEIVTEKNIFERKTTLKKIYDEISEMICGRFVYINKSQIVNLSNIKSYNNVEKIVLCNDEVLYISRNYRKKFKIEYYQYIVNDN